MNNLKPGLLNFMPPTRTPMLHAGGTEGFYNQQPPQRTPPMGGDGMLDFVRGPRPVQRTPALAGNEGGLLGGSMPFGGNMQSPWAQGQQQQGPMSPSQGMFNQYMQQVMQMYPGAGGFFGFQPPALPAVQPMPWVGGGQTQGMLPGQFDPEGAGTGPGGQ